jgi:hypothetical protein
MPKGHTSKGRHVVFLYVAQCEGFVKIGISENPKSRIRGLMSYNPFSVSLLTSFPLSQADAITAETATMETLKSDHWRGDWFTSSPKRAVAAARKAASTFPKPEGLPIKGARRERPSRRLVSVATPDGIFPSMTAAALHYGITSAAVGQRVKGGKPGWERQS